MYYQCAYLTAYFLRILKFFAYLLSDYQGNNCTLCDKLSADTKLILLLIHINMYNIFIQNTLHFYYCIFMLLRVFFQFFASMLSRANLCIFFVSFSHILRSFFCIKLRSLVITNMKTEKMLRFLWQPTPIKWSQTKTNPLRFYPLLSNWKIWIFVMVFLFFFVSFQLWKVF